MKTVKVQVVLAKGPLDQTVGSSSGLPGCTGSIRCSDGSLSTGSPAGLGGLQDTPQGDSCTPPGAQCTVRPW